MMQQKMRPRCGRCSDCDCRDYCRVEADADCQRRNGIVAAEACLGLTEEKLILRFDGVEIILDPVTQRYIACDVSGA